MLLGLRTVIYNIDNSDLANAKAWYADAFGVKPYFDEPFYVGFNVGGYELGLDPNAGKTVRGNNAVAYWGTENLRKELPRFLKLGATLESDVQDVGEGILVATVKDPFGNVIGLIENPHFKLP